MSISECQLGIFVVEDNEATRTVVASALKRIEGFKVLGTAYDGESALAEIPKVNPSVVLLDIGLPKLSGVEVARALKLSYPDIHIVMLTASDSEEDIFASLEAGADGYVLKSSQLENIEIAVRSARSGAVWLDPGIARIVLSLTSRREKRVDPIALSQSEKELLGLVASSDCSDGVCLVAPDFMQKLKRFAPPRI